MGVLRAAKIGAIGVLLCGSMFVGRARAASEEDTAGARAAAQQGVTAFEQKRWADVVDLFSRAESLVHSPVHLLFKARALVQLGQLVKAHETYLAITREQQPATPSPVLANAQAAAHAELAALEPRLASVTIKLQGPGAAEATVTMDGVKVPPALVGLARPVDPGQHQFQAAGAGVQSAVSSLVLKEGGSGVVTLELALKPAAGVAPVAPAPATSIGAPLPQGNSAPGSGMRIGSYVAFGVGALGLAAGTVFALSAKSKYDDANALCKSFPCDLTRAQNAQRSQLSKDGDSAKTVSLVGFIVGGAGVVAGTTLFVLSKHKTEAAQAGIQPWIGLGAAGLSGKF
ncbi:MAG TPA: hypothetical protein VGM44_08990 [Polyangiaceae bacterium]|jgi:hypothetical protein